MTSKAFLRPEGVNRLNLVVFSVAVGDAVDDCGSKTPSISLE
jgi:hypothetical protein